MPQKYKAIRKLSCFNNWSLISIRKHQKTKLGKKQNQKEEGEQFQADCSDSDALPAKTCCCKEKKMLQKYKVIKKLSCLNNWSLISIEIHQETKKDNNTRNPDTVSSDDTATFTEITAENIEIWGIDHCE